MTDNDKPTLAPPPPANTLPPPPDYDALVESPIVRRAAEPPPSPFAGLAEMVRNILAEILAEDAPHTQQSRR